MPTSQKANLAGTGEDSSKYNGVWTSFDINQYTKVKINGAYSEDAASYLVDTGMQKLDCTVRYLVLWGWSYRLHHGKGLSELSG